MTSMSIARPKRFCGGDEIKFKPDRSTNRGWVARTSMVRLVADGRDGSATVLIRDPRLNVLRDPEQAAG